MATEAVFKYLVDTNRPYSCADVTVNLRGAFSKSAVQKSLDQLSECGKIKCKLYGKQKVYAAIQPDCAEGDCDLEDYDTQLKELTENLAVKLDVLKTAENNLKHLTQTPKTEAAESQINEANIRIDVLEKKINTLTNSVEVLSADEKTQILNEHEKLFKEYRKRKRICSDMLEAVLEGYPKSKKVLIEELCIETDEMANFKLSSNS